MKAQYNTLTISACDGGWLVKQLGKPDKIFTLWHQLLSHIENELTSNGVVE